MMERIKINIKAQEQVGAVQYFQTPSSKALDKMQLGYSDEYEQRSYVMDAEDAGALLNQFTGLNNATQTLENKEIIGGGFIKPDCCYQITLTTMEGGLMRADIKKTALISTESYSSPDQIPSGSRDSYLDDEGSGSGTDGAGGDGDLNRETNSKSIVHSFSYKTVNIATHPELEPIYSASGDIKTAIGIIANGGNIATEFRSENGGGGYVGVTTPEQALKGQSVAGIDLIKFLQNYSTYDVKIISVSYKYSSSRPPKDGMMIGQEVPITSLPKNGLGAMFGKVGKAYITNIQCEWHGKGYCEITEQYQIEIVPTLAELVKS